MGRCTVEKEPLAAGALAEKTPAVKKLEVCAQGKGCSRGANYELSELGIDGLRLPRLLLQQLRAAGRQGGQREQALAAQQFQGGEQALASAQDFLEVHLYLRRPALKE